MEEQFFDWDNFEQQDTMCFGFYGVKLKKDIGDLKAGMHFFSATIDYGEAELEFQDDEGEVVAKFKLILTAAPVPVE